MKKIILVVVPFALFVLAGCGDARSSVSGTVTVAGKGPLTGGNIRFISVSDPNRVGGGQIKSDGSFTVPDAPMGECKVVIDNTHLDPSGRKSSTGGPPTMGPQGGVSGMVGAPKGAGGGMQTGPKDADKAKMASAPGKAEVDTGMGANDVANLKYIKLEGAYSKPEETPLKATVKSGQNKLSFDVK